MGASPAPYPPLRPKDVSQRKHNVREVFTGLRYLVKIGVAWRMLPHDLPWSDVSVWLDVTVRRVFLRRLCECTPDDALFC